MIDKKKVLDISKYIIENNATIEEVCKKFSISRRTAQFYSGQYLKELALEDQTFKELYDEVERIKKNSERRSLKNIDLELVIKDIIANNLTNEVASKKYGISESTIIKYVASLDDESDLKKNYKIIKAKLDAIGKVVGGLNGQRQAKNTEFEAMEIADAMISERLTLDEASHKFDVPRSTIYEIIRRINDKDIQDDLDELFDSAKRHK